jgi:hypothetical protein
MDRVKQVPWPIGSVETRKMVKNQRHEDRPSLVDTRQGVELIEVP